MLGALTGCARIYQGSSGTFTSYPGMGIDFGMGFLIGGLTWGSLIDIVVALIRKG